MSGPLIKHGAWHFVEAGSGSALVLLHGIGMSHFAWNAVTPYLGTTRRVIAFDIAGFGLSPSLPEGIPPTISNLVDGLERSLRRIGVEVPVDIAGNSLGGAMALEAAGRGLAKSVVAISPACLWSVRGAPHVKYVFASMRFMARNLPSLSKALLRNPLMRELLLAVPMSVGSRRMDGGDAVRALGDLADSTAFEATFDNTRAPFHATDIAAPVTIAFGGRDWILTKGSRRKSGLPAHTKWILKPRWGHVPMWVDPAGVARLILEGTADVTRTSTPSFTESSGG